MTSAVIYARVSSARQRKDETIRSQTAALRAHAAQLGLWSLSPAEARAWAGAEFPLAVRTASPEQWTRLVEADLPTVRDAGFTEIAAGSVTAVAELKRERRPLAGRG